MVEAKANIDEKSDISITPCLVLKYTDEEVAYVYSSSGELPWVEYCPKSYKNVMHIFFNQLDFLEPVKTNADNNLMFNITDQEEFIAYNLKYIVLPSKTVLNYIWL